MKTTFTYQRYSAEYKDRIIDLLEILWSFDRESRLAYFKWKFEDNPYTKEPLGFIALDGDKVIAFRGYMAQPLIFNGNVFIDASLADTVTHGDYRRMGLFRSLTNFSIGELSKMENILVSLNSSSGGPTLNGYLTLDWLPLTNRGNRFQFTLIGLVDYILKKEEKQSLYTKKDVGNSVIEITTELRTTDIVRMPYRSDKITHERSTTFYNWRLNNPIADYTYCYKYNNHGVLVAFIIIKKNGYKKYDLIDYNYIDECSLKQLLLEFNKYIKPLYILHWTVNIDSILNVNSIKFGFISLDFILNRFKKFRQSPFLVRKFKNSKSKCEIHECDVHQWNLFKIIGDEI